MQIVSETMRFCPLPLAKGNNCQILFRIFSSYELVLDYSNRTQVSGVFAFLHELPLALQLWNTQKVTNPAPVCYGAKSRVTGMTLDIIF